MNKQQIKLVQRSFAAIHAAPAPFAELFYARLFALDPSLRALFKTDLAEQQGKLVDMLALIVDALLDVKRLVPLLQALAQRHVSYGVVADHYATVGAALIWAFEQRLGPAWTREVAAAWRAAYTLLADTMIGAAVVADGVVRDPPAHENELRAES
jgi:hemoglobin-like flavoprotein